MSSRACALLHRNLRVPSQRLYSSARTIQGHDLVLVRQYCPKRSKWRLTKPLHPNKSIRLAHGADIKGLDIIGRKYLDSVRDSQGWRCVLHEVPLATYITHSAREATPIYPADATTIVSLLDLHPARYGEDEGDGQGQRQREAADGDGSHTLPPLEIFEAGTGVGSLTLHLARAIHAANPPVPSALRSILMDTGIKPDFRGASLRDGLDLDPDSEASYRAYLNSRRAVIQSLDHKRRHSLAAYGFVRNFRRAQYLPSVEFHVGSIESYVVPRLEETNGHPIFAHAVLDLPSAQEHAGPVIQSLKLNGLLILFKPSISQIAEFEAWVKTTGQPLRQERVLELPNSSLEDGAPTVGAGGRTWDVRLVKPRKSADNDDSMAQVLRPKVGAQITGGGFLAVYRKWPEQDAPFVEETLDNNTNEEAGGSLQGDNDGTEENTLTTNSTVDKSVVDDDGASQNETPSAEEVSSGDSSSSETRSSAGDERQ